MDITLIIPAYNEESMIAGTLDAAIKHSRGKFKEIIVVDNASTDETAEIARRYGGIRVVVEKNKGLTHARQAGFEAAASELLAYIDADTHTTPQWIGIIEREFAKHPEIVSLSGPRRYFGSSWWRRWILNAFWGSAPIAYRIAGFMVFGGNFVVRRDAITKIGGFDRSIDFYGEDTELARRLSAVGKTRFRMDFYVYSSTRRFEKEGIFKVNMVYALNFAWPVLFHRPFTKKAQDVR